MKTKDFEVLLNRGHELQGVEFKGPGLLSDRDFSAKVIRVILAMANHRDGGIVILGVSEKDGKPDPVGLTKEQQSSWQNYDNIADKIAAYADQSIRFEIETFPYSGKDYVALRIREFENVPVLCNKDCGGILVKGKCYVRSAVGKPQASEIRTHEDMRNLLDLAADKSLKKFITRARWAGLVLTSATDENLFNKQLAGVRTDVLKEIKSRGYWSVIIRPAKFLKERIKDTSELTDIVMDKPVQLKWRLPFPFINGRKNLQVGDEWIGHEIDYDERVEVWRLFQSGQFVYYSGVWDDWIERVQVQLSVLRPEGRTLAMELTLDNITEFFEFAARLALSDASDEHMTIKITIDGLKDRKLWSDQTIVTWRGLQANTEEPYIYHKTLYREKIISESKELALEAARKLFLRFHWEPEIEVLREIQSRLLAP